MAKGYNYPYSDEHGNFTWIKKNKQSIKIYDTYDGEEDTVQKAMERNKGYNKNKKEGSQDEKEKEVKEQETKEEDKEEQEESKPEKKMKYTSYFILEGEVNDFDSAQEYLDEDDMTQYIDDDLKGVVTNVKWVLDTESTGHVEVLTNRELTHDEEKSLQDWIDGQNSDGLGEGFEQQDFAESYYNPITGDGPYTYEEAVDEVTRLYDEMDSSEYVDYIDEMEMDQAIENYINENYTEEDIINEIEQDEELDDEERERLQNLDMSELVSWELQDTYNDTGARLRDEAREYIEEDPESYLSWEAIDEAKQQVANDDPDTYNENNWYGMASMRRQTERFDIEDLSPKEETKSTQEDTISSQDLNNSVELNATFPSGNKWKVEASWSESSDVTEEDIPEGERVEDWGAINYTIYDENGKEIDGGLLITKDEDFTANELGNQLLELSGYSQDGIKWEKGNGTGDYEDWTEGIDTGDNEGIELSDRQKEQIEKLNKNAENGARNDFEIYLSGKGDFDGTDDELVREVAKEWQIDEKRAKEIFNEERKNRSDYGTESNPIKLGNTYREIDFNKENEIHLPDGRTIRKGDIFEAKNALNYSLEDLRQDGFNIEKGDQLRVDSEESDGYVNVTNLYTGQKYTGLSAEHLGQYLDNDNAQPFIRDDSKSTSSDDGVERNYESSLKGDEKDSMAQRGYVETGSGTYIHPDTLTEIGRASDILREVRNADFDMDDPYVKEFVKELEKRGNEEVTLSYDDVNYSGDPSIFKKGNYKIESGNTELDKKPERVNNPYATNNEGGSDDNTSRFANEAIDYWNKKNDDYKNEYGRDDEMATSFRDRWVNERDRRLKGEESNNTGEQRYEIEGIGEINEDQLKGIYQWEIRKGNTDMSIPYEQWKRDALLDNRSGVREIPEYGHAFVKGANTENKYNTGDKVIHQGQEVEILQTKRDPRYGNEYLIRGDEGNIWVTDANLEPTSSKIMNDSIRDKVKNKGKLKKAYKEYLENHPNSKMSYNEFMYR